MATTPDELEVSSISWVFAFKYPLPWHSRAAESRAAELELEQRSGSYQARRAPLLEALSSLGVVSPERLEEPLALIERAMARKISRNLRRGRPLS